MAEAQQSQLEDSLLQPKHAQKAEAEAEVEAEEAHDPLVNHALRRLETFLLLLGFCQSSLISVFLSWAVFLLLGLLIPALTISLSHRSAYQVTDFELFILTSQVLLAAVSLICVSHGIRKYGTRKFLFVDRFHGQMFRFRKEYVENIEIAREILRVVYVDHKAWWQSVGIFLALVVSWIYLSLIFLSACSLFNLICNLQAIHFEDYGKLLERDADALTSLEEHMRLRYNLSKISHRSRIFLLLAFLVVTASLVVSLFLATGYHGVITFISGGDFAVSLVLQISSIIQVVGIILCLHGAAKITHKAQGVAAVASRWHALATCSSTSDAPLRVSNSAMNLEAGPVHVLHVNYSESDLESADTGGLPANPQLGPYMSSYNKRQALGM
ncbi:hypothetical protein ACLOJK_009106 [Asimina triloba]